MDAKFDKEVVRQAASGRWLDILQNVAGMPADILDGRHHPCCKCGGTDRFRLLDESLGAVFCNQCFNKKNGDGFAAVSWMLGIKFGEAKQKIAEHLGVKGKTSKADPARDLDWQPWSANLAKFFLAAKPGITEEALLATGAKMAQYKRQFTVIALPIIGKNLDTSNPVGWCIYNHNGGTLPKWAKGGEKIGDVKIKITYGSKPGLVGIHGIERIQNVGLPEIVWKVEGVTDLLATWSAIPEQLRERHLVITNANGASESPGWKASAIAMHNVNVIHDADEPGQAGASNWATAITSQAAEGKQCRNVQLPYEIAEKNGKDIRDWFCEGHKYGELLDIAEATTPVVVAKTETGEIDYTEAKFPVQELILKKLQIEILYENEMGHVRIFSQLLRKASWIKQVDRLKEEGLIQVCGPPAMAHVSSEPDEEDSWNIKSVRKAIALLAASRRGQGDERGIGIWQGLDETENETDTIVLAGETEGAQWNDDLVLRRIVAPRTNGLVLDFGAGSKHWYDFKHLEKNMTSTLDTDWRKEVIEEAKSIFERWRWSSQDYDPTLIVGLVLATWIQTIWEWRPLITVRGESNSGKSYLFELLGGSANRRGIFGGLAFRQSKSTEAGFRQGIGNTGRVAFCDEFEASKERDKIQELLRASSRGESIARGTTDQKGRQTMLRHIGWTASIETGGSRQPDNNRVIQFEILPAKKGKHGKLMLPSGKESQALGQKMLAISVCCAIEAKQLAVKLKGVQIDGVDARTVESYGVPAAILSVAMGFDRARSEGLLEDLLIRVDRTEQGVSDQDELLEAILTSSINLGPADGVRTVGQVLESEKMMLDHSPRLEACGIKRIDGGLFIHRATVVRQLLRGTDWERQRIDQILMRIPGATRTARRLSGKSLRGILVPINLQCPDSPDTQSDVALF